MNVYDAAVIGGGPAGTAAAISLARTGCSVLLLEAKPIPNDRLCGEFLSPECRTLLTHLGLRETIEARHPAPIAAAAIVSDDGARWVAPLPGTAWGLSRARLDAEMIAAAGRHGVEVHDRQVCVGVTGDLMSRFEITARMAQSSAQDRYQARLVISAHGKRSTMDRTLARAFLGHRYRMLAMKRHFRGPPVPDGLALHGFAGGYCGLANVEDGLVNVCFLVDEEVFRRWAVPQPNAYSLLEGRRSLSRDAAVLPHLGGANSSLNEWLRQAEPADTPWHSVGALAFGARGAVARDILMVGDAAGLIAPLAGDGIAMAIQSGILSAAHAGRFLRGESPAAVLRRGYARAWGKTFGARIHLAGALQQLALRPAMMRASLRVVQRLPSLGRWLVRRTRS